MIFSCDICGERKPCRFYRCFFGDKGQYNDCPHLCKDCVEIQKKEGPVQEESPEENFSIESI